MSYFFPRYKEIKNKQPKTGKAREDVTLARLTGFNTRLQGFMDVGSDDETEIVHEEDKDDDDNSDKWLVS